VDYDIKVFNLKILLFRDEKYRHALVKIKITKYSETCSCSHFYVSPTMTETSKIYFAILLIYVVNDDRKEIGGNSEI
jgi:hypothetical protein